MQRYTKDRHTFISMITKSISLKIYKQDKRKQMLGYSIDEDKRLEERIKQETNMLPAGQ